MYLPASTPTPHPLDPLHAGEIKAASTAILQYLNVTTKDVRFKVIDLYEPSKNETLKYIHHGAPAPDRRSRAYFHRLKNPVLTVAIVNITKGVVENSYDAPNSQGPVDWVDSRIENDPWSFGTDDHNERRRLFQCYMYLALNDDPQANHYSIPLPFAPIFDGHTLELIDLQRLPTGASDEIDEETRPWDPTSAVEYSADLMGPDYFRKDVKPLQVVQPHGPSFTIQERHIKWQKWSFQLGWNMREGPVLHDVRYDGRSLFYRVSMSEMTVPYGDPRSPYHRKQAFDLGGFWIRSHLQLPKLGLGDPVIMPNVVCMHEVDDGIGWKHTNFRNGKSSVVRDRQLVVQCTATVANYEYILAFVLDQAASLHVDVRATGIVSTMPINKGVHVPWGTTVAPGVLAVNHQHLFCLRINPSLDGRTNTVVYDDCIPVENEPQLDPFGCAFKVKQTTIQKPGGYNLDLTQNRTFKILNESKLNCIANQPVGYKLHPVPSQMLMMGPSTFNLKRGIFTTKPIWVTKYRDHELWASGEFTNQSREDTGLAKWAARDENIKNEDVVLWHSFGVTHITRTEDFPVMPTEKMMVSLKPVNFFDINPSNDVPRSNQNENKSTLHQNDSSCCSTRPSRI
ncbi:copper amine oxidase [Penicillium manginii]|uniref:copper amine oxidase n=1 Tax=Penicillium manginii TaxID=203109 RepID=UPI002547A544|nr:copper amine oxidase [Penicillium manginii]KAJ5750474.1 copper amine oxidase [Penicillium manginii]